MQTGINLIFKGCSAECSYCVIKTFYQIVTVISCCCQSDCAIFVIWKCTRSLRIMICCRWTLELVRLVACPIGGFECQHKRWHAPFFDRFSLVLLLFLLCYFVALNCSVICLLCSLAVLLYQLFFSVLQSTRFGPIPDPIPRFWANTGLSSCNSRFYYD